MNDVAGVNQPQADAPVDGRRDVRIVDIQFRVINLGLIGSDRSLQLIGKRTLRVVLLLRNDSVFGKLAVSVGI